LLKNCHELIRKPWKTELNFARSYYAGQDQAKVEESNTKSDVTEPPAAPAPKTHTPDAQPAEPGNVFTVRYKTN